MLPERLTWIDETTRSQHRFLEEGDRCLHFGEYFAYKGYQGGGTNQLILNFKMNPSIAAANPRRGRYKMQAIAEIANGLRNAIPRENAEQFTWIPVPPSKAVGHPEHDDRLFRALASAFNGYNVDVRSLLRQNASVEGDHAGTRIATMDLMALLEVDHTALTTQPIRQGIILFDDLLTTGKHFKCCERRIREIALPVVPIYGIFVARRVLPVVSVADEFDDLGF